MYHSYLHICHFGRKPIPATNSNLLQLLPVKVGVCAKAWAWITSEGVLKLQNAENQCCGQVWTASETEPSAFKILLENKKT